MVTSVSRWLRRVFDGALIYILIRTTGMEWVVPILSLPQKTAAYPAALSLLRSKFCKYWDTSTDALDKPIGSAWYRSEKISRELNYRPVHTLRSSLPEMVAEFRKSG